MEDIYKTCKNILLVGDKNLGKTTYTNRLVTAEFLNKYIPTLDNPKSKIYLDYKHVSEELYNINTPTDSHYNLIESTFDNYIKFVEKFKKDIDGVIIMYDCTTYIKENKINEVVEFFINVPIVICRNKYEPSYKKYKYSNIYQKKHINISSKSNYNFDKPFFLICKEIANK